MEQKTRMKKSCGNCVQCEKGIWSDGKEHWTCENNDRACGMPVGVNPPYDEACSNWSDDPDDKDKPQDALRDFVYHFWDDYDDLDD